MSDSQYPNTFKDHFSTQSGNYQRFRPSYPPSLFKYLSELSPSQQTSWDCATGSGQAAISLSEYFQQVYATDASKNQITNAEPHSGINFVVAPAEASGLKSSSVDLICVAQAFHWFNFEQFFEEADRVLKPNGILAVWSYELLSISPEIDKAILHFYNDVLDGYWPPERRHIENNYQDISFPYKKLQTPDFEMVTQWDLSQLAGYFSTWSAVKRYIGDKGFDPVIELEKQLRDCWGEVSTKYKIIWPLNLIVTERPN